MIFMVFNTKVLALYHLELPGQLLTSESKAVSVLVAGKCCSNFKWKASSLKPCFGLTASFFSLNTKLSAIPGWSRRWSHHRHVKYGATSAKLGCCRGGSSGRNSGRRLPWGLESRSPRVPKLLPLKSQNLRNSPIIYIIQVYIGNRSAKAPFI